MSQTARVVSSRSTRMMRAPVSPAEDKPSCTNARRNWPSNNTGRRRSFFATCHPLKGHSLLPRLQGTPSGQHIFSRRHADAVEVQDLGYTWPLCGYCLSNGGLARARCACENNQSHQLLPPIMPQSDFVAWQSQFIMRDDPNCGHAVLFLDRGCTGSSGNGCSEPRSSHLDRATRSLVARALHLFSYLDD